MIKISFCVFMLFVFSGCLKKSGIVVTKLDTLTFRRSFAGHENWTDAELDSVQKENPISIYDSVNDLERRLTGIGLIKDRELQIHKFDFIGKDTIKFFHKIAGEVKVFSEFDTIAVAEVLSVKTNTEKLKFKLDGSPFQLFQMNIYNSSYQEIVILRQWYIMNGDMYDLTVFKIE